MSVAELPPRLAPAPDNVTRAVDTPRRSVLTIEHVLYLLLFAVALVMHLWGLGDRALHHDETHHAFFSWRLFTGQGYVHDPLLHGPFLYHLGALIYFLFGDNDFTARLGAALFGSVLVVLPYFIRREIGRGAALLAAVYLLISPAYLYVGRFIRHDMYAVVFELLAFIGIIRYASTRNATWLYVVAASLGLMFTTMETFFLYLAMLGSLLGVLFLWRVWKPGIPIALVGGVLVIAFIFVLPGEPLPAQTGGGVAREQGAYQCPSPGNPNPPANPFLYEPGPLLGLSPLPTADNTYALCVRHQPDNNFGLYFTKLSQFFFHPAAVGAIGTGMITLALLIGGIWFRRGRSGLTAWERARIHTDGAMEAFASLGRGRRLWIALAIFLVLYLLFFSAFFSNPVGMVSGATGSLLYWLAQHDVQRGGQPGYYYLVLLAIYEPLVLFWSVVGLVMTGFVTTRALIDHAAQHNLAATEEHSASNGGPRPINWNVALPIILAIWSIATVGIYSWAGEKMPWLTIHVALPLVLLAAWALARTLRWGLAVVLPFAEPEEEQQARREQNRALLVFLGLFGVITVFCFLLLSIYTPGTRVQQNPAWAPLPALVLGATLGVYVALTVCYGLLYGARRALGAAVLAVVLLGAVYSVRSAYQLSYRWGDVPREMMIYTQTSPDVARVIRNLEEASIRRTGGYDMPIWYDGETVWNWYTRRFTNGQEYPGALPGPPGEEVMAVLIMNDNLNSNPQNLQYLQGFQIHRMPLRWWFPEETYRMPADWRTAEVTDSSPLLMRALRNPTDGHTIAQLWQFLIYRQTPAPLGSTDVVIAVRPEIAPEIGLGISRAEP